MLNAKLNSGAMDSVPENGGKVKDFDGVKRAYETAYLTDPNSNATATALLDLSTAVAYSVINKCLDPQRIAAASKTDASNSGYNPALLDIKRGIASDIHLLDNTADAAAKATKAAYTDDGDPVTVVADKAANDALASLIDGTLTDGIDLMQAAACAILEQAVDHASAAGWLDRPYTVRRLSRRVYIRAEDSAAYADVETTPIQEVYRAVRKAIQDSRAVQTDPRNGYTYIEDMTDDGLDTIYRRLQKWADLGGSVMTGGVTEPGGMPAGLSARGHGGGYAADAQTAQDYYTIIAALDLTPRQREVLELRMQGKGYKAIATYLGVTQRAIAKTVAQIQAKAIAIGLTPDH